jgi:hypothetical protein
MRAGQQPDATDANKKAWEDGFKKMTGIINGGGSASLARPGRNAVTAKAARNAKPHTVAVKAVSANSGTDAMDCHDMGTDTKTATSSKESGGKSSAGKGMDMAEIMSM